MTLTVSVLQGGTNSHQTTSEEINFLATDLVGQGVIGTITNTSGVAPATGAFAANAQGSPNMTVAVSAGVGYVTATPTSGNSQLVRVKNSASANVTISANSSGGTRFDWIYVKIDPDKAKDPALDASDVATLVVSRSTSATTDNGTPPTYGYNIAVVTVANAASSITNGNIADKRARTGAKTNLAVANPYKFSAYRTSAHTSSNSAAKVSHDSELFDTNGDFASSKYTAPVDGFYWFNALAGNTSAGTTPTFSYLYKNGSVAKIGSGDKTSVGIYSGVSGLLQLVAGDYVEHYFIGGSGSTMDVGASTCYFEGYLVSLT